MTQKEGVSQRRRCKIVGSDDQTLTIAFVCPGAAHDSRNYPGNAVQITRQHRLEHNEEREQPLMLLMYIFTVHNLKKVL